MILDTRLVARVGLSWGVSVVSLGSGVRSKSSFWRRGEIVVK